MLERALRCLPLAPLFYFRIDIAFLLDLPVLLS